MLFVNITLSLLIGIRVPEPLPHPKWLFVVSNQNRKRRCLGARPIPLLYTTAEFPNLS